MGVREYCDEFKIVSAKSGRFEARGWRVNEFQVGFVENRTDYVGGKSIERFRYHDG